MDLSQVSEEVYWLKWVVDLLQVFHSVHFMQPDRLVGLLDCSTVGVGSDWVQRMDPCDFDSLV